MEESRRRAPVRVWQKGDPGHDHTGFVCGYAWRRDSVDADLCRSDPSLRPGWSRLDAGDAGNRGVRGGARDCASAADETRRQSVALVRHRVRFRDHPVWVIESILVIAST